MAEEECGNLANIRYTWPGKDEVVVCAECAIAAQRVAKAIGLHLQVIPFDGRTLADPLEWPHCKSMRTKENA